MWRRKLCWPAAYFGDEGVAYDSRESYIWFSITTANDYKLAENFFRDTNWLDYLSQSEIREAEKEAARRLNAINNR